MTLIERKNNICNTLNTTIFLNNLGLRLFDIISFIISCIKDVCEDVEEIDPSRSMLFCLMLTTRSFVSL